MDKAQIERLDQLTRLAQGKDTKRTKEQILASEKSAGEKYTVKPKVTPPAETTSD